MSRLYNTFSIWFAVFTMCAAALLPQVLHAQESDANTGPPPAVAKLLRFEGNWHGKGTVIMGDQKNPVAVTMHMQKTSGGWGLRGDMTGDMGNMGKYIETDLMGYEPNSKTVHLFSVTNMGETHDHAGTWDDNTLNLHYDGTYKGEPMHEALSVTIVNPNKLKFSSVTTVNGQPMGTFEATVTK